MVEQELAPPLDKPSDWVAKKIPLAPPWPTNNGDSFARYGAEESLCLRAIRNMASFTTEFGKWREVDADQTFKDLEKLPAWNVGTHCLPHLPHFQSSHT